MKITVESTSKVVEFEVGTGTRRTVVPARIWEGATEDGTPVHCYITRICPSIPEPLPPAIEEAFASELKVCKAPTEAVRAIPLRMIL